MTTDQTDDTVELTDKLMRDAVSPPGKTENFLRDSVQLGYAGRIRASGSKSLVYLFTRPGRKGTFKTTIGPWPKIKVAAGRKEAAKLAGQRAGGTDLVVAKREQKEAAQEAAKAAAKGKARTVGALISDASVTVKDDDGRERKVSPYEAALEARHYAKIQTALSALRRNLLPEHRSTDIRKLTRLDITIAMDKLVAAGKPGAAADLRKHAHTFLAWAERKGYASRNVLMGFRKEKATRAERLGKKRRGRALTDNEIRSVWHAAGKLGTFGLLARLCLLGGPRRSEPTMIEWSKHVMPDRVTFDAEWTKMGLHHDIPRTALVDQVLDDAKRFQRATSDYVFPSSKTGGRISGFTKLVNKLIEEAGTAKWTMHDLRRSLRTVMSKCGYDNDVQRLCVGQKPKGIDAVYNLDEQWAIRKMAFEAAHSYLSAAIEGRSTDAVVKHQRATNPANARKIELLARLAALHAEG